MNNIEFALRGDHITLDALLKATGLAESGGAAKALIADGQVEVDGQTELRKSCKVRAGQRVTHGGIRINLRGDIAIGDVPGNLSATDRL